MADAVTSQIIFDGDRVAVVKLTNLSDGTGEVGVLKVDASALIGSPTRLNIEKIWFDIFGMQVQVLWDATVDETAWILTPGQFEHCFTIFGGLTNNAGAGRTGDILFSTIGASANDSYSVVLYLNKLYS